MDLSIRPGAVLVVLLVFASLLVFYTGYDKQTQTLVPEKALNVLLFKDFFHSLRELNKILALGAIGLVSITFLLGPLSKLWPKRFTRFLSWRKFIGISGFAAALLHGIYSIIAIYDLSLDKMIFSNPNAFGFVTAVIALAIFFVMTLTSTKKAMQQMGYEKWKKLQTTGYIALVLAILHFIILETKPDKGFDVRPYGILFLFLALLALTLRMGLLLVKTKPRTGFEEHTGETPE